MDINIEALTLNTNRPEGEVHKASPKPHQREKFLKGPIPLNWIIKAGQQKGRALHVGIILWFLVGIHNSRIVRLSSILPKEMHVGRHALYSALQALEAAGLIRVERHRGRRPKIEILKATKDEEGGKT
jgi:hypothetical protein